MSSLKDQLAKLGMIDETKSENDRSNTPRAWTNDVSRSNSSRTPSARKNDKSNTKSKSDFNQQRKANSNTKSGSNRRPFKAPEPLAYRSDLSDEERAEEIRSLFKRTRLPLPNHGQQRFYFELKDGVIDYIETDDQAYESLSRGAWVITNDDRGRLINLPRETVRELNSLDPNWIPKT